MSSDFESLRNSWQERLGNSKNTVVISTPEPQVPGALSPSVKANTDGHKDLWDSHVKYGGLTLHASSDGKELKVKRIVPEEGGNGAISCIGCGDVLAEVSMCNCVVALPHELFFL